MGQTDRQTEAVLIAPLIPHFSSVEFGIAFAGY